MAAKKPPKIAPTLSPSSRADLEKQQNGVVARGPGGGAYRLRQINLERHVLSGGLPATLIDVALKGQTGITELFEQLSETEELTPEQAERNTEIRDYLDNLVLASVVEPKLTKGDLGDPTQIDADSLLPPLDYQWIVSISFRETDHDADGRRLWGVEPLTRFRIFAQLHDCPPDCQGCFATQLALSAQAG